MDGKIAPESSNVYQFTVKNSTKYNLKYRIKFIETNEYNINMQYKLKKNDTYIIVCLLLSLYLFSCYFSKDDKEKNEIDSNDEVNETEEVAESALDEHIDDKNNNKSEETDINENTIIEEKNKEVKKIIKKKPKKKK